MLLGPIFTVDVVTSARRVRYFVLRMAYAAILFFLLWMNYEEAFRLQSWQTPIQQAANFAASFFFTFSVAQLLAVLLVGPALAAATIASERERRTIEYLFATDLTNSEIVLSKLAARLLQVGCLVLAGLPILALAMLMGGIAPVQLLLVLVITLGTTVTVGTLGIAVSVSSPRVRDALGRVYILLFALLVLPGAIVKPMLQWLAGPAWGSSIYDWVAWLNEPLIAANPLVVLWETLNPMVWFRRGSQVSPWTPVVTMLVYQLAFSALLAALSVWSVRRVHLAAAGKSATRPKVLVDLPRPRMGEFPMLWKESLVGQSATSWGLAGRIASGLVLLALLGPTVWMFFASNDADQFLTMATIMSTLLCCGGLLVAAGRAASSITAEKERDTWLTLISTPLEGREIIAGKILGTLWAQRGLVLLLALIWLLQMFKSARFVPAVAFTAATLAVLAVFVAALGTMFSLRLRNSTRAMGVTLATLIFVGGGYFLCCGAVLIVGSGGGEEIMTAPVIPFFIAFPGVAASQNFNDPEMQFPYVLGNIGYLVAAVLLWSSASASFDRLSGRTSSTPDAPRRPASSVP